MPYIQKHGKTTPGSEISVYTSGTSSLADIFSDSGVTPKVNPFASDITTGDWSFYYSYPPNVYQAFGIRPATISTPDPGGGITIKRSIALRVMRV